jgi:hypothetical protein
MTTKATLLSGGDGTAVPAEFVGREAGLTQASGVTWPASGGTKTVTSRTFTAGTWLIWGDVEFAFGSAYTASAASNNNLAIANLSTTNDGYDNNTRGYANVGVFSVASSLAARADAKQSVYRFNSTTTVYLCGTIYYTSQTGGTMNGSINGIMIA